MIDTVMVFQLLFCALLVFAAVSDARHFRIPNLVPALVVILFIIAWWSGFPFADHWWAHLFHFVAALLVGMLLFRFGWFGGGDAKLYASVALWFSFRDAIFLLFVTTAAGALIVIARALFLLARSAFASAESAKAPPRKMLGGKLPYGIAIAAGGIVSIAWLY